MKRFVILFIFVSLSAGQVLRVPSSYQDGVKWEFGANSHFHNDVLTRSNVDQDSAVPTVYKKELVAPIARREPVIAVYKKPPVIPDVYEKEPIVQYVRKQQSAIPIIFRFHTVASNIYKSEPVVHNVYKQHAAVPIVHKTYPAVPNVYHFKNQLVQPVVHYQQEPLLLQDFVRKDLPLDSQKKVYNSWNYQHNPHDVVHGNVHLVPHN